MIDRWKVVLVGILLLVVWLVYGRVVNHQFLPYDDDRYITANPAVQQGVTWETVAWAFTTSHASNWHPLTWISHMIDIELFGLDPRGHHLVNLLFHLLNTLLLFVAFQRLTGAFWQSFFVAALFALHPLHVESVAWVAERKDVLSMFFFTLSLWTYARYSEQPTRGRFFLVFLCMLFGVLSKPMIVSLPFVLLLLDYWPLKRIESERPELVGTWDQPPPNRWRKRRSLWGALVWEKFWLFVISIAASNITLRVQEHGGAVSTVESTPLAMRFSNAAVSYVAYIKKTFWPYDLAVFYPHHGESITLAESTVAVAILVAITVFALVVVRRHRSVAVGWFWYLGTLVPVIGLVQVGAQAMADRYTYIPLIGLFVMIVWGGDAVLQRWKHKRWLVGTLACAVVVALSLMTKTQVAKWNDGITLFESTLSVTRNNWVAHHNLAWELHRLGRFSEAEMHYKEALRIYPNLPVAHYNLGRLYMEQGKWEEARTSFDRALAHDSSHQLTHIAMGKLLERESGRGEAIRYYRQLLKTFPSHDEVHYTLALLLLEEHEEGEAIEHLQKTLELDPFNRAARAQMERLTGLNP